MIYLVAAVVLVGLLCLFDLILSVGIIRRLRELQPQPDPLLPPGAIPGDFTATTLDGHPAPSSPTLVGIFTPGCQPCAELMPHFLRYAHHVPGGRDEVLAVIAGEPGEYLSGLSPVARVVRAERDAPVLRAFQARAFPAVYLLDADRRIVAAGARMEKFPAPVPVHEH